MSKNLIYYLSNVKRFPKLYRKTQKNIFFYTVNYDWIDFCTSIACILERQNDKVHILFQKDWDFENVDPNKIKKRYKESVQAYVDLIEKNNLNIKIQNVEFSSLENFKLNGEILEKIREQVKIDICHKHHIIDSNNLKNYAEIFDEIFLSYKKLASFFMNFFSKNKFDTYIIPSGANYGWAICKIVFEELNIDYISIDGSVSFNDKKILIGRNYPITVLNSDLIKSDWKNFLSQYKYNIKYLKKKNYIDLEKLYNSKFSKSYQKSNTGLPKLKKKRIVILTSFMHEMHFRLKHLCFENHNHWFEETLNFFLKKKTIFIILKL